MSNPITESSTVQSPLIRYAEEAGWTPVSVAEALSLRQGEGGLLFGRVLAEKLVEFNPGFITEEKTVDVIRRIESVRNTIEGNAEVLAWLRGEQSQYDEAERRERNVTVIDFENPDRNVFHVTDEWTYANGMETNRADVMFLINGIPVAIVETKSAQKTEGMDEALVQIRRYHRETPEMLTMPQVFEITHLLDFYYGVTWNLDRKNIFKWKGEGLTTEVAEGHGGEKSSLRSSASSVVPPSFEARIKSFFDRCHFLAMLKEWILFYYKDDELQKSVLRQHQTRAVDRILTRCAEPAKRTGLIWHTQGSGKTFTMITAARLLLQNRETFGKATVILMIDRNELEGQLSAWVDRILGEMRAHDIKIEQAYSKQRLRELLASDFRGLIISMIHKFEGIPKDINTGDHIHVFVDEAHRTTGGDLGNYLMGALPNATLIGFTGTPIDRTAYGKGTFKVFGKEDDRGYLDKYSIRESIEDKTTVPLKYTLAPSEMRVDRAQLEKEFLDLAEAEGVSDIDDLNRILDRATNLKTFLKSKDRVEKVAAFVARHFQENVEPLGYKAFLVGVDREACALYKEELDRLLPPEQVTPIYTSAQNDAEKYPLVHKHQRSVDEEKRARKQYIRPNTDPRILIVTDKLLTGFDAQILYCMYLDKPMRDHVLLQAIARVNRPYEWGETHEKPCGLVVDFVGIFEKLEKALAFDSDVVSGVIEDIDLLFVKFRQLMEGPAQEYLSLVAGTMDDKAIERALHEFADRDKRQVFMRFFKEVETLYEILSPSPDLRPFIEDFGRLSLLYRIVCNTFQKRRLGYADVARKTEMLIRERTEIEGLDDTLPDVRIDAITLKALRDKYDSPKVKIINLVNGIRSSVRGDSDRQPFLKPIGDRAEVVIEQYDDRQISTEEALKQIEALAQEIIRAREEQQRLGFDAMTFAIYWALIPEDIPDVQKLAVALDSCLQRFKNHRDNINELRQLKAEMYKLLLPAVGKERMIGIADRLLRLEVES